MHTKHWFKRKKYGFGWTPSSWQGWLVTIFFLVIIIFVGFSITEETRFTDALVMLAVPALLLVSICYMTGEK